MTAPMTPEQLAEIGKRAAERGAALTEWLNRNSPFPGMDAVQGAEEVLEVDVPALLAEIARLREFERRLTEEVEEMEDAAREDPGTPRVARHMIRLLRMAMTDGAS